MASTGETTCRIYGGFRGADFRGDDINLIRSPDCLNVWKDHKNIDSIRTRPGMELIEAFDSSLYGVFFFKGMTIVHSGTELYKIVNGERALLFSGVNATRSDGFVFNNIWYFKDGANYLQYDGNTIKDVEGFVPTTSIGRTEGNGGTVHQDVNLLSDRRINTFVSSEGDSEGNGIITQYHLDTKPIDRDFVPIVKVDGKVVEYDVEGTDYENGIIYTWCGYEPTTDGQDNVSIEFKKAVDGHADRIKKCTLLQVFDNRVFFSGNPDFPNVVYHCSLNDPSYCSDLDYYNEGHDDAAIKGMVAGNNALWVFREPSSSNTTVFYHAPTIDADYGKIYPSSHSSISTGCVGRAINFNDDIVFFSDRGMEGISGAVTEEQVIAHRSTLVDRKLLTATGYSDMILEEWEGYLLVFIGNKVYLADSRSTFANGNHIEYEWFYWELEKAVTCAKVHDGILYLGTEDGLYTLTDTEAHVESYWVTPKDKFGAPQMQKTTNKRGCIVEATGDISVYAKTESTDFEHIGTYENITDSFACRIKRKKFKDIQLKFYSSTRFSLETATLECFIGGYIKK